MADAQRGESSKRDDINQDLSQNITSEDRNSGNMSTSPSMNQQNALYSRSQEPWNVLMYWMSAQYYQQYYYSSYMYYWQMMASHFMYQGAFQSQSNFPQSGLHQQRSQSDLRRQQPQNNAGLVPGRATPWVLQGQQAVRTGLFLHVNNICNCRIQHL